MQFPVQNKTMKNFTLDNEEKILQSLENEEWESVENLQYELKKS